MNTVKCPYCGKESPEGSKFCQFCGKKTEPLVTLPKKEESASARKMDMDNAPSSEKRRNGSVWKWVSIALIVALLGGTVYLLSERSNNKKIINELMDDNVKYLSENVDLMAKNSDLLIQNTDLMQKNSDLVEKTNSLTEQKKQAIQERDAAKQESKKAIGENRRFEAIKTWADSHRDEYSKKTTYYAGSNAVIVKKGETANLSIIYNGQTTIWERPTNDYCSAEWSRQWDYGKTTLKITGVRVGTSEIVFSEGKDKNNVTECFRVLVIVY